MYRPRHSAATLRWSSSLEASAQQWANRCVFEHQQGSGQGENLAWGYADNVAAIDAYYAESSKYTYGQANPSNFHEVGHFTQVGGHVGRVPVVGGLGTMHARRRGNIVDWCGVVEMEHCTQVGRQRFGEGKHKGKSVQGMWVSKGRAHGSTLKQL